MTFKYDLMRAAGWKDRPLRDQRVLDRVLGGWRFRIWGVTVDRTNEQLDGLSVRGIIDRLVGFYAVKVGRNGVSHWVDHTPSNIRYLWKFLQVFPEARFVHIVRDGRAVAASLLPLDWGPNDIAGAARYWRDRVVPGLLAESLYPERVVRVRYEDLVLAPERTLEHLSVQLRLSYERGMALGRGFIPPVYSQGQHALVGRSPDATRIDAWLSQLSAREIEIFESIGADLLEPLGYAVQYGVHARRRSPGERVLGVARELYRRPLNRSRRRARQSRGGDAR